MRAQVPATIFIKYLYIGADQTALGSNLYLHCGTAPTTLPL